MGDTAPFDLSGMTAVKVANYMDGIVFWLSPELEAASDRKALFILIPAAGTDNSAATDG